MGFRFSETMSGTAEWTRQPGKRHPFRFDITAQASTREYLTAGIAHIEGTVFAPPMTRAAKAEGTITIRPLGKKFIRYQLAFTADDGQTYDLIGQKDILWRQPLSTFTTLPADIFDRDRRKVGSCLAKFDLRRDLWKLVRSFRPAIF